MVPSNKKITKFEFVAGVHPSGDGWAGYFGVPGDSALRVLRNKAEKIPLKFTSQNEALVLAARILVKYINDSEKAYAERFLEQRPIHEQERREAKQREQEELSMANIERVFKPSENSSHPTEE